MCAWVGILYFVYLVGLYVADTVLYVKAGATITAEAKYSPQ